MNKNIDYENNPLLFDYIEQIIKGDGTKISLPNGDIVFSSMLHLTNPENAIEIFEQRYNNQEIQCRFSYENYLNNKDIQRTITGLKLDVDAFWLLVMFCFDFSYSLMLDGLCLTETPKNKLSKLWQLIDQCKELNLSLNLQTDCGNLTIDDDQTMSIILNWIIQGYKNDSNSPQFGYDKNTMFGIVTESNSVLIWHFASLLKYFFDLNPQIRGRAKKGDNGLFNKNLLISRIIYYTRLSTNPNFKDDAEILKGFFKQYKGKQIQPLSSVYPTF